MNEAGFREIKEIYCGIFNYVTENFLESDFSGDKSKLEIWNDYIRKVLPKELKKTINYKDNGESISMDFIKKIIKAIK